MAKDEWEQPDKIGVHPKLVQLTDKFKKLIELENLLLHTVKSDIERFNENKMKREKNDGSTTSSD